MSVDGTEEKQAEGEKLKKRQDRFQISGSWKSASPPPFHPTLSMCNLTCSADWLPAAALAPEALAQNLVPYWVLTSPKHWQGEGGNGALQGS